MILAVGTKLEAIITRMAVEITERHAVVQGMPVVQVSDKHFWFSWPQLVLYLIHFVLFQVYTYIYGPCMHVNYLPLSYWLEWRCYCFTFERLGIDSHGQ